MAIKKKFVRSILNLGDFCDDEVNNEPSMTDPSQDEPIEKMVARMLRGEMMRGHVPVFDKIPEGMAPAQVFAMQPTTERDDFDLADSGPILAAGIEAAKLFKAGLKPPTSAPAPAPAAAPAPAVPPPATP